MYYFLVLKQGMDPLDPLNSKIREYCASVTVTIPKCDDLLSKCDELQSNSDSVAQRKSDAITNSSGNNQFQSKIMSIGELFDYLKMEACKMESKQFSLPPEYLENINLDVSTTAESDSNRVPDENSGSGNDPIKSPPRHCYYCKKICANDEIVKCDFCTAHFHMNCLDPPLSCVPDVKWMCPLHPHHFLNKIMARSYSISEFTSWWNKIAAFKDERSIEDQFITKIRSSKKREETTKTVAGQPVKIPEMVKYHYEQSLTSPSLLEHLTEPSERNHRSPRRTFLTAPRTIKKCRKRKNGCRESHTSEKRYRSPSPMPSGFIEIVSDDNPGGIATMPDGNGKFEDYSLWDTENHRFKFTSHGIYDYDRLGASQQSHPLKAKTSVHRQAVPNTAPVRKEMVDDWNEVDSSWRRIKQIVAAGVERYINEGVETENVDSLKKRLIERKLSLIVRSLPPSFVSDTAPYPFMQCDYVPKYKDVHAALCPLSHYAPPVYMYNNLLKVGTDVGNDLCLLRYGVCEFVSAHHATIFYNEFTNGYELMNYSEYNCVVDGVCYTNNILGKSAKTNVCRRIPTSSYGADVSLSGENDRRALSPTHANNVKKVPKRLARSSFKFNLNKNKRSHSKTTSKGRESRYPHQKLMPEIEKHITKSQKEMTAIANEDLNEIARILKNGRPATGTTNKVEEVPQNSQTVFIINLKRKRSRRKRGRLFSKNTKKNPELECVRRSEREENQTVKVLSNEDESQQRSTIEVRSMPRKRDVGSVLNEIREDSNNQNSCQYNVEPVNEDKEKEARCKCRASNSKFPIGGDSSWEKSAPLHHGSHIKFGCIEFVFSIADAVSTSEEPPSEPKEVLPIVKKKDEPPKRSFLDHGSRRRTKDSDLSMKLTSILSLLSSESRTRDESSSSSRASVVPSSTGSSGKGQRTAGTMSIVENGSIDSDDTNSMSSYSGSNDSASQCSDYDDSQKKVKRYEIE